MAANTKVIRMLQVQRAKLERKVARAEQSIAGWKGEMDSLDGAISALAGGGGRASRPRGAKGRKRGTWKRGHPGRPPKWYVEQQKAKGSTKLPGAKRKRKVSPKVLAALAMAREARAKKRKAEKSAS